MPSSRRVLAALTALLLILIAVPAVLLTRGPGDERAAACTESSGEHGEREREAERERSREGRESRGARSAVAGMYAGPGEAEEGCGEAGGRHPESFADLARANSAQASKAAAPGTQLKTGAYRSAVAERAALDTAGGQWKPFGNTPLEAFHTDYDTTRESTKEGLGNLAGRATAIVRDPATGTLYTSASNGGVWKSTDGTSWTSVGEPLPTQVVSGLAWSPAAGGTLIVLTGDNAFGGNSNAGQGVYATRDGGASWQHASGIPDGLLGFKVAVDPTNPSKVYAATGGGLFRSTDAGTSFENVALPTGPCAGKPVTAANCFLANVVTDVVVQGPGNDKTTGGTPGRVLAAVGWRAGTKPNAAGVPQSPANGLYASDTGAPGSFENLDFADNATGPDPLTQPKIGRIALGTATGPDQDHQVVYAIVQDAVKFNGGASGLDVNENGLTSPAQSDFFNAVWASTDFGRTWRELDGSTRIDDDPTSQSALAPPTCKTPVVIGYCPGVQAWYNLWVEPDPTQQTAAGVPTRLGFGLEEVWDMHSATGLDGTTPQKSTVVGRYFASCTLLTVTNQLPVCPTAAGGQVPADTTHPDQHGALWVPDATGGGVTLYVANDGGIYRQHVAAGEQLSNEEWGQDDPNGHSGVNKGMNTLQPYDAAMAKDGTLYMGLQDNGEAKVQPDGTAFTIYGGDGFFSAVDPDHSDTAYEEYVGGAMSKTLDGGKTWTDVDPGLTSPLFSTPFEMDTADAAHLLIGGRDVQETTSGAGSWTTVYDLGTRDHPGTDTGSSGDDPDNQLSAVDTRSFPAGAGAPTGPHTADMAYTGGAGTVPGLGDPTETETFVPGTYEDHPFTIGADDGDASVDVTVSWADATNDWDLYLYRKDGGTLKQVASSASGSTSSEHLVLPNPAAGDYVVRVVNFAATGTYDAKIAFAQRTSGATTAVGSYVGYCGFCDTITQGTPFGNGVATNVGGSVPGKALSADGWHIAAARGLPERYITSVRMDPQDPRTVYVTLAGYGRKWAFPGAVGEDTSQVGTGHVFRSTDAGETFTDVTGNLPDVPANWSLLHNGHLVVGTDIGVFESCDRAGGDYARLGQGLPTVPISTLRLKPGDPDTLIAATNGRGVYTYRFGADDGRCPAAAGAPAPPAAGGTAGAPATPAGGSTGTGSPAPAGAAAPGPASPSAAKACAATSGFRSVRVRPRGHGLRFDVSRRVKRAFTVDVFQSSHGRRVLGQRRIAHFTGRRRSFTWNGRRRPGMPRVTSGVYFARVSMRAGAQTDVRRTALSRSHGRFHRRAAFHAPAGCRLLSDAKLSGPAFGGRTRRPLGIALRLARSGRVTVTARQGARRLKRWSVHPSTTAFKRLRLPARLARRGDVRVTLVARTGTTRQTVRLTARRLAG